MNSQPNLVSGGHGLFLTLLKTFWQTFGSLVGIVGLTALQAVEGIGGIIVSLLLFTLFQGMRGKKGFSLDPADTNKGQME